MKKSKQPKEETVEDITPYWSIMDGWEALPEKTKFEYYWQYSWANGVRVFPTGESDE